jgi:pantoate--beta-alanine ligase
MERCADPAAARRWSERARRDGATLGFVPTMGALHDGHMDLVARARAENDLACVSVFVNPLQFDDPRDFERYPRDLEEDARQLAEAGCAMLFGGTLQGFFPEHEGGTVPLRRPGPAAEGLEGAHRPGHFAGVATICARLFEVVQPTRAYFGEKDFQQCLVVEHLAGELGTPTIVRVPTRRDADGLALSSRNALLEPEDRPRALALVTGLRAARAAYAAGERDVGRLEALLAGPLGDAGLAIDYAVVREPRRLATVLERVGPTARALVAARLGRVRLIDNMALEAPG